MEVSRGLGSGRCLDVDQANGNVIIWDCHGGSNQQWAFKAVFPTPLPPLPKPPPRGKLVEVGREKVLKLVPSELFFYPRVDRRIQKIVFAGNRAQLQIDQVQVVFRNGRIRRLEGLEGTLGAGQTKAISLLGLGRRGSGKWIQEIQVVALSPNLIGSRGELVVQVQYHQKRLRSRISIQGKSLLEKP